MGRSVQSRSQIAQRARELMCADVRHAHTISELARACETSPTVLKEAFREEYGLPVYEWFRRRRMICAAKLLVRTDAPVAEVARAVGYANPSKFARAFADCLRMRPHEWRARYRRG